MAATELNWRRGERTALAGSLNDLMRAQNSNFKPVLQIAGWRGIEGPVLFVERSTKVAYAKGGCAPFKTGRALVCTIHRIWNCIGGIWENLAEGKLKLYVISYKMCNGPCDISSTVDE